MRSMGQDPCEDTLSWERMRCGREPDQEAPCEDIGAPAHLPDGFQGKPSGSVEAEEEPWQAMKTRTTCKLKRVLRGDCPAGTLTLDFNLLHPR